MKSLVNMKDITRHTKVNMIEALVSHVLTHSMILSIRDFNSSLLTILSIFFVVFLLLKYALKHKMPTETSPIPFNIVVKVIGKHECQAISIKQLVVYIISKLSLYLSHEDDHTFSVKVKPHWFDFL